MTTVTVSWVELTDARAKIESAILSLVGLDAALPTGHDELIDDLRDVLHTLHSARGILQNELLDAQLQAATETPTP